MGIGAVTDRAIFLDRDGVINCEWWNPQTQEWESPIHPKDFRLQDGVLESLWALKKAQYRLFLVSNQPSAAKGKCTLEDLRAVHELFVSILSSEEIQFDDFFYCYTHPDGKVPELTGRSPKRKPSPYFLNRAIKRYRLERAACWMIGDRATDVACGKRAGVRTIQVSGPNMGFLSKDAGPDFTAPDLPAAVGIIMTASRM